MGPPEETPTTPTASPLFDAIKTAPDRSRRRRAKRTFAISTQSSAPTQGTASRRAEWRRRRTPLASAARETLTPAASSVRRRNYAQQKQTLDTRPRRRRAVFDRHRRRRLPRSRFGLRSTPRYAWTSSRRRQRDSNRHFRRAP